MACEMVEPNGFHIWLIATKRELRMNSNKWIITTSTNKEPLRTISRDYCVSLRSRIGQK